MNYEKIYQYRFEGIDQNKRIAVCKEISNYIYTAIMDRPTKVLDPCAGRCEFINHIAPQAEAWAVDIQAAVQDYKASNVKAMIGDIFSLDLPENYFEAIFVSNFLEHLESSEAADRFLTKMYHTLAPKGKIVIMGPNFKYCAKQYFDCIDHRLILTDISVMELLYSIGFRISIHYPKFLPFSFRGLLPPSKFLIKIYLHSRWAWPLLGKQFLIVAEKP